MRRLPAYLSAVLRTLLHLILSTSSAVLSFRFCFFRLRVVATSLLWRFFCSSNLSGVRSSGLLSSPGMGCSVCLSKLPYSDGCSKACSSSAGSSCSMAGYVWLLSLSRRGLEWRLCHRFDCFSSERSLVASLCSSSSLPLGVSTMYTS